MPTEPPDQPRDLDVTHDLSGLRYRVSAWEGALLRLAGTYFVLQIISALTVLGIFVLLGVLLPDLVEFFGLIFQLLYTLGVLLPFLLAVLLVYQGVTVDVRVDQNGMQLNRKAGGEQITWAACADVRRDGRMVEVLIDDRWRKLPSPNAYTDAAWLEGVIRDKIDARRGDATAPPEEVAAALRALGARKKERSR